MMSLLAIPLISSIAALVMVFWLRSWVKNAPPGNERMQELSGYVQQGARAFLKREYTYVGSFLVIVFLLISAVGVLKPETGLNYQTGLAFLAGALASMLAGYSGMSIATLANCRTTEAARDKGLNHALAVAVSGGAVMGLSVVGIALLGLVIIYMVFKDPEIVNGYAMGASLVALFARVGGGIFTKGADMGADLVGKVEAGIPEDDPRNPAVIADNVGDNVGDVAGLGADLLESFVESMIACMAIAVTLNMAEHSTNATLSVFPLLVAGLGIIASIVGIFVVKTGAGSDPQKALMNGTYVSGLLSIVATFAIAFFMKDGIESFHYVEGVVMDWWRPAAAAVIGIFSGMGIGFCSEYYTSSKYAPTKRLSQNCQSGPAIAVTGGLSVGMQSTGFPILILAVSVVGSFWCAGVYGIAMAALGMLATTGMVVAVDSYGPIADNAGGIAEMAQLDPGVRKITDHLDSVGNTTAAIGKGFAIGSAAFAAIGLITAFMVAAGVDPGAVALNKPTVVAGLLVGGMLPFVFSSWLFKAVDNAAFRMIEEVRRQFREIKGLMEGTAQPDSTTCVDISTKAAIAGMIKPGIMAIVIPVLVGLVAGPEMLAGVLVGALVTGVMLGIQTANSGGAMDNAKKYIEEGNFGGKNSDAHKAAVVGDTVGDPLKDTVGPSINILIKLMAVVSLVLAPLL
ncbi:MAG: sodium-translocating pyrophosphatase [Candidatus Omnitrophica bacterium]|nr:sodium-translocating pyrophosphatase [Candidatus Omnitrophota bacterium]MCB9770030.1 sodium-translocating pyrophosphatase [Candidatus Omnitrophota bacterium]MCB9781375.1 sodium-translocating pyrophosphatase [Candidatus Omnitrophota bacterium]